jgi:hypothetical protein
MIRASRRGTAIASTIALTVGAVTVALWALPASATDDSPPSGRITVNVVAINGSGCPAGTATVSESADNTSFTVTYHDYTAKLGGAAAPTDVRKNCQLGLEVNVPQGFTFAIAEADYRGNAKIADGATAVERANYYFQGSSATASVSHTFDGPYSGGWSATDVTDVAALVFSPCGLSTILNVNTSLHLIPGTSSPSSSSYISMDQTQGSAQTIYHFAWKTCS